MAGIKEAKTMGFASILSIVDDAMLKSKKHNGKGKGKKRAGVVMVSLGVGVQAYTPMRLPSSIEAYPKAMALGLGATNAILPPPLCADPMLPLVATLAIFRAMLDSPSVAPKDKEQVTKAGDYLAKRLAIVAALVDKSMPAVAALYDTILHSEGGRQRGPGKTLLFYLAHGLAQRVLPTKLVKLDGDVCPYLTALMGAALV